MLMWMALFVLVSVFARGMSAAPGATRYGKLASDASRCPAEHKRPMAIRQRA